MKRFATRMMKGAAALLISLLIWEVILRATILAPIPYAHNDKLGWMPAPHTSGVAALEGWGYLRFNELGFRGGPLTPPVPGETRILCLGDSYTLGAQMNEERSYPRRLQTLLRGRGAKARVFNAGRAGTTITYSVGLSDEYKKLFQPDWTVVQIRDGWGENFNRVQEIRMVEENLKDGDNFRIETHWHWKALSPRMKQLIRWHIRDIALFQYGNRHLAELRRNRGTAEEAPDAPAEAPAKLPAGQTIMESGSLTGEREKRAIAWTVARLKAEYPRLILLHIPYGSLKRNGLVPPQIEEKILIAECRRQNVPLITMRSYFERDAARSHQAPLGFSNTLPWTGHPNARAHDLMAQALADYLTPRLRD